ncbi:MAG: hypothetical protein PVH88_01355 [Ignavibacteria bacterium]
MEINSVRNNGLNQVNDAYNTQNKVNQAEQGKKAPSDKIEISQEAKMLQTNKVSTKDFAKIQERINTDFYNSEEVINKVADSILKEIASK